jgi:hypothetical protein
MQARAGSEGAFALKSGTNSIIVKFRIFHDFNTAPANYPREPELREVDHADRTCRNRFSPDARTLRAYPRVGSGNLHSPFSILHFSFSIRD